ncbi:hypothetical protein SERLADRAFT_358044 [Serpula lacrymans var. lacrymans S7.9]|uniref:Uncharacterized protein n=1 Tax=Serpula lacrymans var. lacrymans (strain S7.9) TaxID=578457 RepID=F8P878_SERL9|nr:uncharacterized protein SERLADRAFT_358044 [Serpula lacrymans var. lacrymans S7.9]EGO20876.1 hypothetical protein SERLADRAFT_358044 [Serpula lacrymans var. lacrymans S7.9]
MPPQPGMFALPYASTHTARADVLQSSDNFALGVTYQHQSQSHPQGPHHHHHNATAAGSRSSGLLDDPKGKKRKDFGGKIGPNLDTRGFAESISSLHSTSLQLATRPETHPLYVLRLYPLSLERSALLSQISAEEKHALRNVHVAWAEERERVEDEWKRGRERIRERLLEGIEERRRRAREEKEGEGTDSSLDSQTRPHITRKLRNKFPGNSPPPTPGSLTPGLGLGLGLGSSTPITTNNTNPHSLSIDELPSPFPLSLTSVVLTSAHSHSHHSRRRIKPSGAGLHHSMSGTGGLGKSLAMLAGGKEGEIEADLGEIRRASKRKRGAALVSGA